MRDPSPESIYKAFGDKTRLRILIALRESPRCVTELEQILASPQSTVSRHLAILRQAGLVEVDRDGPWSIYRLPRHTEPLRAALLATLPLVQDRIGAVRAIEAGS
ncbi:MAG: ArsR family transcriptional regulator [Planctomycetota bacterium]|nr:MAG: ArsR family transcriptional regulator [Planctomycetota bacterium]